MRFKLYHGDCLDIMRENLEDNSVDTIITDPPYGLSKQPDIVEVMQHWLKGDDYKHRGGGFMGKSWDSFVPGPAIWIEALRVLKPGGFALVFASTRTADLMGIALRFAGFEIRDTIMWIYGSGFPKSLDVSKAIDKAAGAERQAVSATPAAQRWQGWGTALKPAHEPIIVAMKPLDGTYAENALKHGVVGLNIDGGRVETEDVITNHSRGSESAISKGIYGDSKSQDTHQTSGQSLGRWPANVILTYPEDQYVLRDDVTPDQLHKLAEWMNENAKH